MPTAPELPPAVYLADADRTGMRLSDGDGGSCAERCQQPERQPSGGEPEMKAMLPASVCQGAIHRHYPFPSGWRRAGRRQAWTTMF